MVSRCTETVPKHMIKTRVLIDNIPHVQWCSETMPKHMLKTRVLIDHISHVVCYRKLA